MYLRTQCDKELYLSLIKKDDAVKLGIPAALKSRPGVQLVTTSGREFEYDEFDKLIESLPGKVIHKSRGRASTSIIEGLIQATADTFILQPEIQPQSFRDFALTNLELATDDKALIPSLAGLKPDALFIHKPELNESEILPDGRRKPIQAGDTRLGVSVIDLKNVTEANPSYSAEVCLYAFFLSNWLYSDGAQFKDKFYISDSIYLWKNVDMPNLERILGLVQGGEIENRVKALIQDLKEGAIDYLIYMPSVKKFFREDLPRVIKQGDAHGWESLIYHVNSKCGSCDWLGFRHLLTPTDARIYDAHPEHYCLHTADKTDHLSKMDSLSRGASNILVNDGLPKIESLVDIASTTPTFKKHVLLKRDRENIGKRAAALTSGTHTVDNQNKVATLAKYWNAEYCIVVNFDSSSGLLTGISLRGILSFPFGKFYMEDDKKITFRTFSEEAFVVPKNNAKAEWVVLRDFIQKMGDWVEQSERLFNENGWGSVHTQIIFWEPRQYQELCNAFSRHLVEVLELTERAQRALIWIFPADELMERETELAPGIVFIRDIIRNYIHLPVKFSTTLLGTASHYHFEKMAPKNIDKYYIEPLGNAIPRERIFEIWQSSTGLIKSYGKDITIQEAIGKYKSVLKAHAWALASITAQLRFDLRENISGQAPAMNTANFRGAASVAYDSKLWIQWDKVSAATSNVESLRSFVSSVNILESSYNAIVLTRLQRNLGNHEYEFEVSEESTEAKLDEGDDFCVLGIVSQPGYPLQTPRSLGLTPEDDNDQRYLGLKMHKVISVRIVRFDRVSRRATIRLRPGWSKLEGIFNGLFQEGKIPIFNQPIFILKGLPPDYSEVTTSILRELGNPQCAKIDQTARIAMGSSAAKKTLAGTDADLPMAKVLWSARELSKQVVRTPAEIAAIKNFLNTYKSGRLNPSQKDAIINCVKYQLTVVWGPPGTGKTDTLVGFLHALIKESKTTAMGKNILVTGPNYRAVEELLGRLIGSLNEDTSCSAEIYGVYSSSREPKALPTVESHIKARSFRLINGEVAAVEMYESLADDNRVTVLATTAHIVHKIRELTLGPSIIQEMFDVVIIDESSQVELTMALRPLALLKPSAQLVIAGDQLQMPPIAGLEPPKNAEYLVGSIQTYLLSRFKLASSELHINYRSADHLVEFARTLGYPSQLRAYKDKHLKEIVPLSLTLSKIPDGLPKSDAYLELLNPSRVVTALIHEDIVSSQANEVEAKLVAALAFCLRNSMSKVLDSGEPDIFEPYTDNDFFEIGIGVVTPHKAQKALVIRELKNLFPHADPVKIFEAVDTVERFQGGERQTILVSFGVGDTDIIEGEEAFLLQMERTNVAVSRAQAKCIVIMPKALAYHLPSDQKAAKTAIALKSYIEEFCSNRKLVTIDSGKVRHGEVRWH